MNAGLIIAIAVVALDVLGGSLDGVLYLAGLTTVTSLVRSGGWWTLVGIVIVLIQFGIPAGLAWHFWNVI
jgi:hypothetical protein